MRASCWREGIVGHRSEASGDRSQTGFTLQARAPVIVPDLAVARRFAVSPFVLEHGAVSG